MRLPDPRRSERMIMPIPFAWSLADGLPRSSRQKHDRSGYMAYVIIVAFRAKPGAISAVATISTAKLRRR